MKRINSNKQQGFSILAVILVIVAVIVAIGVWALSGQTNTSSSGNSTSDIQAASLINDSGAIKLAFDTLVINGSSANNITFVPNIASTPGAPNMLDPVNGVQVPKPNANAIVASATAPVGIWIYNNTGLFANSVGEAAGVDQAILVAGVKDIVCQRVNNTLYGNPTIPVTTVASAAAATVDATTNNPISGAVINLSSVSSAAGWTAGCFATAAGADQNVFFRVLKAN